MRRERGRGEGREEKRGKRKVRREERRKKEGDVEDGGRRKERGRRGRGREEIRTWSSGTDFHSGPRWESVSPAMATPGNPQPWASRPPHQGKV